MNELETLLNNLEDKRLDYVMARSRVNSDSQALRDAGIARGSYYTWSEEDRIELNKIAQRLKRETALRAMMILSQNAEKAANKITELIDDRNKQIALAASKDVIDRVNGRAIQKTEITGEVSGAIQVEYVNNPYPITDVPSESSGDTSEPEQV